MEQILNELKTVKADILAGLGEHKQWTEDELKRIVQRVDGLQAELHRPDAGGSNRHNPTEEKSLAGMLFADDNFQNWARTKKGRISFGIDGPIFQEYRSLLEGKTTITTTAVGNSTPGILVPARVPGIIKPGVRRLRVRDLLPNFPTRNNAVEFIKENVFTNAASPTVENTGKPESALTFTIDSKPVRVISHWIPISKQILSDFIELNEYLNSRMIDGLRDKEDTELLFGDGLGDHLSGIALAAAAYETSRNVSGDTRIDKLNHAFSQLEDVEQEADGVVLHPRDWRAIQLVKEEAGSANTGSYILGSPATDLTRTLWGLPVATTTAMPYGKFLVGAFRRGTAVWDRMEATIDISTEHASFFTSNLVAVLCEERICVTVFRSDTLVYGAF